MRLLTIQEIMAADDLKTEDVPTPEWAPRDATAAEAAECGVRVRTLTGIERDRFNASLVATKNGKREMDTENIMAKLVAACMVGPDGRKTTEAEAKFLGGKSSLALQRVFDACQRLNGMGGAAVETLQGNSDASPSESSPSISASPLA